MRADRVCPVSRVTIVKIIGNLYSETFIGAPSGVGCIGLILGSSTYRPDVPKPYRQSLCAP